MPHVKLEHEYAYHRRFLIKSIEAAENEILKCKDRESPLSRKHYNECIIAKAHFEWILSKLNIAEKHDNPIN